jgi:GH15 family glucan-1,4-alpha-glucosidase
VLLLTEIGLLETRDPRFVRTVEAIEREEISKSLRFAGGGHSSAHGRIMGEFFQTYSMAGLILTAMQVSPSWEDRFWRG